MLIVYLLIAIVNSSYFTQLSAERNRLSARDYNFQLPETRILPTNISKTNDLPLVDSGFSRVATDKDIPSPVIPTTTSSRGRNINSFSNSRHNNSPSREAIVFPDSESDEKSFTETTTESNIRKRKNKSKNKKKIKQKSRVLRQTDDFEPEECGKCLDKKYLKHYYEKGCQPIEGEFICKNSCPKYFKCPEIDIKPTLDGCEYKGITYKINEDIPVPNECTHCRCVDQSGPAITCAVSECFGDWMPINQSCYRYYEFGKCCSRKVCLSDQDLANVKTCLYDQKNYKIGEKIYPKEDNCVSCICDENWNQNNPINSTSCQRHECDFELQIKWKNRQNCVPIYHENTCCPIDFHCPTPKEWKCLFDDKYYEIGDKLESKANCVDCVCRIPPDFTCIRRKCDPIPTDPNCLPTYEPNECCPTYNCSDDSLKLSKRKNKLMTDIVSKTEQNANNTTTSACPPFLPEGLVCVGTNCKTTLDSDGCQTCSCESPCPQLECTHPCYMFAVDPQQCPECSCP